MNLYSNTRQEFARYIENLTSNRLFLGELLLSFAVILALISPIIVGGRPLYMEDAPSYLRGGRVGFEIGLATLERWWASTFAGSNPVSTLLPIGKDGSTAIAEAGGARSISYSLLAYLLRAPGNSLSFLVVAQAVVVASILLYSQRIVSCGATLWARTSAALAIALLTTAPWYASTAMPDIFAGVAILASAILTIYFGNISCRVRIALVFLLSFAVTTHISHIAVSAATLMAGAVGRFWIHRPPIKAALVEALWFASPLALALGALHMMSFFAFQEVTVAPKRYPISLARSIADGPGLWHLRAHCSKERYAVCEVFGESFPTNIGEFLWGPNGVRYRATPEQMERIRAEEFIIVGRAAREYPFHQFLRAGENFIEQLWRMGLRGTRFGQVIVSDATGQTSLVSGGHEWTRLLQIAEIVTYVTFLSSLSFVLLTWRWLTRKEKALFWALGTGLIINAAVCGILSSPADRYQGRVAWVIAAITAAVMLRILPLRLQSRGVV